MYHYFRSELGGDDWSRTSSAFRAADLQSTGVTNFPTSPKSYHIETHSDLLTTLFLSIQDAPGSSPAAPLGCMYLSIQVENAFQYGTILKQTSYLSHT